MAYLEFSNTNSDSEWGNDSFVQQISHFCSVVKEQNHVIRIFKFGNFKGPSIQNLEVEVLIRIVSNMWKVFKRPTCASDFLIKISRWCR
jgi:hypothetical protein